jgi:hypothetical protein
VQNGKTAGIQAVGKLVELNYSLFNDHGINLRAVTLATVFIVST